MQRSLRIGTRGSRLALAQTTEFCEKLALAHGWSESEAGDRMEMIVIRTKGDRASQQDLTVIGGKGLFVKDLEVALRNDEIDVAIHSIKDMLPVDSPGLDLAAVLSRGDPRDALVSRRGGTLRDLPEGARLGTSSPRRKAQILAQRPDLVILPLRGNIDTRLAKIDAGDFDAAVLAYCGLQRIGQKAAATEILRTDQMLPAAGQAAIGAQIRENDSWARDLVSPLNHLPSRFCIAAERHFLRILGGSCRTPIAGFAEVIGEDAIFRGQVLDPKGRSAHSVQRRCDAELEHLERAHELGESAAIALREAAGDHAFKI